MRIERVVDAYLRHVTVERGLSAHTTAAYRRDLEDYRRWLHGEGVSAGTMLAAISGVVAGPLLPLKLHWII